MQRRESNAHCILEGCSKRSHSVFTYGLRDVVCLLRGFKLIQDWHLPVYSSHLEYIILLTFTLPTPVYWCTIWGYRNLQLEFVRQMPHTSQHTRDLPNLSYDCNLWKHLIFRLLLALFRLVGLLKRKDYWTISHCFHRIFFWSRVYMYVHEMRSTGIIMNYGRLLELVASTSHVKVPSTGLWRTPSKT